MCSTASHPVALLRLTPLRFLVRACWHRRRCLNKFIRPSPEEFVTRHVAQLESARSSSHFCKNNDMHRSWNSSMKKIKYSSHSCTAYTYFLLVLTTSSDEKNAV